MRAAEDEPLQFAVGPVELEATIVVAEEAGVRGGVKFWVVEAGADAKEIEARTHRVKLTLNPTVAGGPVHIGGAAEEDED